MSFFNVAAMFSSRSLVVSAVADTVMINHGSSPTQLFLFAIQLYISSELVVLCH